MPFHDKNKLNQNSIKFRPPARIIQNTLVPALELSLSCQPVSTAHSH